MIDTIIYLPFFVLAYLPLFLLLVRKQWPLEEAVASLGKIKRTGEEERRFAPFFFFFTQCGQDSP